MASAITYLDYRIINKQNTTTSNFLPEIGPSLNHTDGNWEEKDIYSGELVVDSLGNQVFIGSGYEILKFLTISNNKNINTDTVVSNNSSRNFIAGTGNQLNDCLNQIIFGNNNSVRDGYGIIVGLNQSNSGYSNLILGSDGIVNGQHNTVLGSDNDVISADYQLLNGHHILSRESFFNNINGNYHQISGSSFIYILGGKSNAGLTINNSKNSAFFVSAGTYNNIENSIVVDNILFINPDKGFYSKTEIVALLNSYYSKIEANANFLSANTSFYNQTQTQQLFVTTGTTQTISGEKTFTQIISTEQAVNVLKVGSDTAGVGPRLSLLDPTATHVWNIQMDASNELSTWYLTSKLTTITKTGNFGIGTTAPSAYYHGGTNKILEVLNPNTTLNSQSHLILSSNSTLANNSIGSISFMSPVSTGNKGVAYIGSMLTNSAATTNASGHLIFATSNGSTPTEKMRIDNLGNVGIGTTTPSARLTVVGNSSFNLSCGTAQTVISNFANSDNNAYLSIVGIGASSVVPTWNNGSIVQELVPASTGNYIIGTYTGSIKFQTNNRTDRVIIDNSGNVGIGATPTTNKLQIGGNVESTIGYTANRAASDAYATGPYLAVGNGARYWLSQMDASFNLRTYYTTNGGADAAMKMNLTTNSTLALYGAYSDDATLGTGIFLANANATQAWNIHPNAVNSTLMFKFLSGGTAKTIMYIRQEARGIDIFDNNGALGIRLDPNSGGTTEFESFMKIGAGNTAMKYQRFSGSMPNKSSTVNIPFPCPYDKIVHITCIVDALTIASTRVWIPPLSATAAQYYTMDVLNSTGNIVLGTGSVANGISGRTYKVFMAYEG